MSLPVQDIMSNQGFEDVGTGGGCYGWFTKKGKYTYYITVLAELTLPKGGEDVTISVYDKDFNRQYLTMDISDFNPKKASEYLERAEEAITSKSIQDQIKKNPDEIIYL